MRLHVNKQMCRQASGSSPPLAVLVTSGESAVLRTVPGVHVFALSWPDHGLAGAYGDGIRLDSGSTTGSQITPHSDPLLAKLIAYGESRAQAMTRRQHALASCLVEGVHSNLALLQQILRQARFQTGDCAIDFLAHLLS